MDLHAHDRAVHIIREQKLKLRDKTCERLYRFPEGFHGHKYIRGTRTGETFAMIYDRTKGFHCGPQVLILAFINDTVVVLFHVTSPTVVRETDRPVFPRIFLSDLFKGVPKIPKLTRHSRSQLPASTGCYLSIGTYT